MAAFYLRRDGRPAYPHWLIAARNRRTGQTKYLVTNAPPSRHNLTSHPSSPKTSPSRHRTRARLPQ